MEGNKIRIYFIGLQCRHEPTHQGLPEGVKKQKLFFRKGIRQNENFTKKARLCLRQMASRKYGISGVPSRMAR
jgi:hypothetical protein